MEAKPDGGLVIKYPKQLYLFEIDAIKEARKMHNASVMVFKYVDSVSVEKDLNDYMDQENKRIYED